MDMAVGRTLSKKRANHLVTCESGPSKTQFDYCLLRRNQRKFLKDIKVLPKAECPKSYLSLTQHKPLILDFKIGKVNDSNRKFVSRRNIWKLCEDSVSCDFRSYINSQKDASVEGYWNSLKGALLEAVDRSYGWTRRLAGHKHRDQVMMLVIGLKRSANHGRSGNGEHK